MNSTNSLFHRLTTVPTCCLELPTENKCLPCQKCELAWNLFHQFPDCPDAEAEFDLYLEKRGLGDGLPTLTRTPTTPPPPPKKITIDHVRNFSSDNPKHYYVGRRSDLLKPDQPNLGNPFQINRDGDREACILKFKRYLWRRLKEEQILCAWLRALPEDATLFCHCHPKQCHAQVIADAAKWLKQSKPKLNSTQSKLPGDYRMSFGQFDGRTLRDIQLENPSYLDWMLGEDYLFTETRRAISKFMDQGWVHNDILEITDEFYEEAGHPAFTPGQMQTATWRQLYRPQWIETTTTPRDDPTQYQLTNAKPPLANDVEDARLHFEPEPAIDETPEPPMSWTRSWQILAELACHFEDRTDPANMPDYDYPRIKLALDKLAKSSSTAAQAVARVRKAYREWLEWSKDLPTAQEQERIELLAEALDSPLYDDKSDKGNRVSTMTRERRTRMPKRRRLATR